MIYPNDPQRLSRAARGEAHNGGNGHHGDVNGEPGGNGHTAGAAPARVRRPAIAGWSVVTGGAGFIGTNIAHHLLQSGRRVLILDNLSRPGVERNVAFLRAAGGERLRVERVDVRDLGTLRELLRNAEEVYHFAAQVAVTSSLADPVHDFETNARGTLNVLEAIRSCPRPPRLLFTSTNKVYGALERLKLAREAQRYEPADRTTRHRGVDEQVLDFHSPYGCSKGCADQYVLDYARTFGVPAAVLRMSCIYGPHQCGNEDQGWVAHFLIRAIEGRPITIYGDGRQVRDVLYIDDLVAAMRAAMGGMDKLAGRAFNMGGGPSRTVSLLELLKIIGELTGAPVRIERGVWRPGDQRYYVSDTRRFEEATGWSAQIGVEEGVRRLHGWLVENRQGSDPAGGGADAHAGVSDAQESSAG